VKTKLSNSSISMYLECPQKYKLHYIDRIRPVQIGSALLFGGALDKGLNELLLWKSLDEAKDVFLEAWTNPEINGEKVNIKKNPQFVKYSKNNTNEVLLKYYGADSNPFNSMCIMGELMLDAFYTKILPRIKKIPFVQEHINIKNSSGDSITGILDYIMVWEDDKTYLMDNKSSVVKYEPDSAKKSRQLVTYYHAMKSITKLDGVGFTVFNKNIKMNKVKRCLECHTINNGSHKTCNNIIQFEKEEKRCCGKFIETFNPECEITVILNQVNEQDEATAIQDFDTANQGISNNVFPPCDRECGNKFGPCIYYKLCHENDTSGFVKLSKK
jgi:hypothetical protein